MAKATAINLLRGSETHYVDTILKWALSTGRFLIILTETIALAAFVYRFTLDREIIDLADSIKDNQAIVSLYRDEPKYRNLHERLNFVSSVSASFETKSTILEDLVRLAQDKAVYQRLSIGQNEVNIELITNSTGALSSYIESLRSSPKYGNVSVYKVENKAGSGMLLVGITAKIGDGKEGTNKNASQ